VIDAPALLQVVANGIQVDCGISGRGGRFASS
jgi:hypothetical protein